MTKPVDDILPLPLHKDAAPAINFFYSALHEMVCFGTHILSWNLSQGKGKEELGTEIDMVVPLLFRHLLEVIDAIAIQIQSGAVAPCRIHLRAFIEAFLSLEYILEKDRHSRSANFLIVDYYRKLDLYKKLIHNSPENKILQQDLAQYGFVLKHLKPIPGAQKAYDNVKSLIEKPMYDKARNEYLRLKKDKKDVKFYNFFSKHSTLLWLSKHLKYYDFYEFFYKEWSNPTHGTNLHTGVLVLGDDGLGAINQIRNVEEALTVTDHVITFSMLLFSNMVNKVVPEHKAKYAEWHLDFKSTFRDKIDLMK